MIDRSGEARLTYLYRWSDELIMHFNMVQSIVKLCAYSMFESANSGPACEMQGHPSVNGNRKDYHGSKQARLRMQVIEPIHSTTRILHNIKVHRDLGCIVFKTFMFPKRECFTAPVLYIAPPKRKGQPKKRCSHQSSWWLISLICNRFDITSRACLSSVTLAVWYPATTINLYLQTPGFDTLLGLQLPQAYARVIHHTTTNHVVWDAYYARPP